MTNPTLVVSSEAPRALSSASQTSWILIFSCLIFFYFCLCEIKYLTTYTFAHTKALSIYRDYSNLELGTRISNFVPFILFFTTLSWFFGIIWALIFTNGYHFPREWTNCTAINFGDTILSWTIPYHAFILFFLVKYLALSTSRYGFPIKWFIGYALWFLFSFLLTSAQIYNQ